MELEEVTSTISMAEKAEGYAVSTSGQSHHTPELRIVLIGGREIHGTPGNKSATGNIILRKNVFETNRRTAQSVVRQQEVYGRQVTVVDTPGWWWHYPRENTPELDQMEIRNSVYLCPPGPHTFLLVIPVDMPFTSIFTTSLEEHLQLFHKGVLCHTIVLFTVDTQCSDKQLANKIRMFPGLQLILDQCGNRKHVLNVSDRQDRSQVTTLFNKIEALVAENAGRHFSIDSADGNALRVKMEAVAERASKRFAEVQTKRKKLRALIEGGKSPPTHLRIVMVGAQWSAKSSAGNTILGKEAFAVHQGRTTEYSEISHSMVADRQLTVVDSPGWFYNRTLQDTSGIDKLEIENSVYLCPPGPHAVLLVVGLASAINTSYQRAVQEHMSLFTDEIWKHTIVLFTRGDWLGVKTVEERIESEKGLQWLVEKCGNKYHVLDNTSHDDATQVVELLEKIEEMWAANEKPYYEVDLARAEQVEKIKEAGIRIAERITQRVQRQDRILKELFRGEMQRITNMRIMLVGRKESGKSMAGNRIFFEELFGKAWMKKEFQHQRRTTMCVKHQRHVSGANISVVEAPGWLNDAVTPEWLQNEFLRGVSMCAPGPHVFLLVIPISKSFTEKDRKAAVKLLMPFGETVWRHCMVLFTWGDWLNDRSIEDHIAAEGEDLQWLVEKCRNRYHVITCNRFYDGFPIMQLLLKMMDIIAQNRGNYVTTEAKKQPAPQAKLPMLTEEEWNRREQELIDRMLKAVAQELKEPTAPPVEMAASIDGVFIPSMCGDVPSEVGKFYQKSRAKVSEWLIYKVGNSDVTSGVGSMSASASYVEKLEGSPLTDESHQPMKFFFPEKGPVKFDTALCARIPRDTVETKRRYSF